MSCSQMRTRWVLNIAELKGLRNVLRKQIDENGNTVYAPFELDNAKSIQSLLHANKHGLQTAAFHVFAKLGGIFGGLTGEDYET